MKKILYSMLALAFAATANAQVLRTTVAQGEIEGDLENGFALYKAIPYAEAPVGNLRWKSPVPKAPWQGVYHAENWGSRPPQQTDPNQNGNEIGMSEDCLYLCVMTPAKTSDERLPVFVNIHGGAFVTGSYAGGNEAYCKEGIVYCSIAYRLGVLGFMAHPELSKENGGISGNYGIQDQILALQWIHDNIAAFGGDPDKITIAGESAGGISVSMLCASPRCKGLFRGAISESGGSFWPVGTSRAGNTHILTSQAAEPAGLAFQQKLGCKNLKQLRKLSFEQLISQVQMEDFWPVVDGVNILDDQYKLYQQGNYNDVNVLIGSNSDEGALFVYHMPLDAYRANLTKSYGTWADRFAEAYPASNDAEAVFATADIFRDGSFAWPTYAWANLQSANGKGQVYLYYFDQDSENTIFRSPRGGAIHVAEMPFCYPGMRLGSGGMTETDLHMQQIMSRYWINFTKTGNPNGEALPYWAPYKEGTATVMNIRNGFRLTEVPNLQQLKLFEEFFQSIRK